MRGHVSGLVQGVNFRWFTQRQAAHLGVTGWVRNLPDGSVEFVAEGDRSSLDALVEAVRVGPASAAVETLDTDWSAPTGEFHRFEVRY